MSVVQCPVQGCDWCGHSSDLMAHRSRHDVVSPRFRDPGKQERDRVAKEAGQRVAAQVRRREAARRYEQSRTRTRIRPRSSGGRKVDREMSKVAAQARERDGDRCVAAELIPHVECWGRLDPSHVIPKSVRPDLRLDVDNVLTVCRGHHEWLEEHPVDAMAAGLAANSWDRP